MKKFPTSTVFSLFFRQKWGFHLCTSTEEEAIRQKVLIPLVNTKENIRVLKSRKRFSVIWQNCNDLTFGKVNFSEKAVTIKDFMKHARNRQKNSYVPKYATKDFLFEGHFFKWIIYV